MSAGLFDNLFETDESFPAPEPEPRVSGASVDTGHEARIRTILRNLVCRVPDLSVDSYSDTGIGTSATEYHRKRGVPAEIAVMRGVRSGGPDTGRTELPDIGDLPNAYWSRQHARYAGTVGHTILTWHLHGARAYQARWDEEIEVPVFKDGEVVLVEAPKGSDESGRGLTRKAKFSFPVMKGEALVDTLHANPGADVHFICEGVTKADALAAVIGHSQHVSICAIAGVDGAILGRNNPDNESDYLPRLRDAVLDALGGDAAGKTVIFPVDADGLANEGVRRAMSRFLISLTRLGAHGGVVVMPSRIQTVLVDRITGTSTDLDEYIGAKAGVDDVVAAITNLQGSTNALASLLAEYMTFAEWERITRDYGTSDTDRALRLADELLHRNSLVIGDEHWYWTGNRYVKDGERKPALTRIAQQVAQREVLLNGPQETGRSPLSTRSLKDVIALAMTDERLSTVEERTGTRRPLTHEDMNVQVWEIPVLNGMYDPLTDQLLPHDPSWRNTYCIPTRYKQGATDSTWEYFIKSTFITKADGDWVHDADTARQVRMQLGVALVRKSFEVMPTWYGRGNDGKSSLTSQIQRTLAPECYGTMDADVLTGKQRNQFSLAKTRGVLILFLSEAKEGATADDGFVKTLASKDRITSQTKHRDEQEHQPVHMPIQATNFLMRPHFTAAGAVGQKGFWRRMHPVPFNNSIDPDHPTYDPMLDEKLALGTEATLAWIIEGLKDFIASDRKFFISDASRALKAEWMAGSDPLEQFMIDCIVPAEDGQEAATFLHASEMLALYRWHCGENRREALGRNKFYQAIGRRLIEEAPDGQGSRRGQAQWPGAQGQ